MRLFGLQALPLTLALLLVAALLMGLYLHREPPRRVDVPSLTLWLRAAERGASRHWASLRRPLSLLLALAIATLLLLALADPRPARAPRTLVLLIDRGSSMSAHDVAPDRLTEAKRLAHAYVDAMYTGDRALVIAFAAHATGSGAPTADRSLLHAAIDAVTASDARSDPAAALELAGSVVPTGELLMFSDAAFGAPNPKLTLLRVGTSARNVGIAHFSARSYPLDGSHAEAQLVLENFGDAPERATLRVHASQPNARVLMHEEQIALRAGQRIARTLSDLPGRGLTLEATLELADGPDALARDDRALAILSRAAPPRVLLVSDGDRYLEAALLLDEELALTRVAPSAYHDHEGFDLVIFDRTQPTAPVRVPALYLGGGAPLPCQGDVSRPFFDRVRTDHALLSGLALRDVNVGRALRCTVQPVDIALASARDGTPLLVQGQRDAPFIALTFALADSDLPLRAAFPVLILRALQTLRGPSPGFAETHVAGEPFVVPLAPEVAHASLRAADGSVQPLAVSDFAGVHGARVLVDRAGTYALEAERSTSTLAIAAHAPSIRPTGHPSRMPVAPSWYAGLLWPLLAASALVLLALEWLARARRWTS